MQQKSGSKVAWLPLLLFVVAPVLGFLLFRHIGVFFIALFFNPVFSAIGQMFRSYEISNGIFREKGIFRTSEFPVSSITSVEKINASIWQQILMGLPAEYLLLHFSDSFPRAITPAKELFFQPQTGQLYFKN